MNIREDLEKCGYVAEVGDVYTKVIGEIHIKVFPYPDYLHVYMSYYGTDDKMCIDTFTYTKSHIGCLDKTIRSLYVMLTS
jgi:hypothetical protein